MEAAAGSSRTLFLLTPSPPLVSTVRLALGVGRRRLVAAGARKRRGKNGEEGEERVDPHSFNPKAGEVTGPFPESVLLRKKTVKEDGEDSPEFADAEEEKLYELLNIQLESGLNLQRMRHYEVVYLIHEDRVEEVEDVVSKVQEEHGGKEHTHSHDKLTRGSVMKATKPCTNVIPAFTGEALSPQQSVITAALEQELKVRGELAEDYTVPVFPQVPEAEEGEGRRSHGRDGWGALLCLCMILYFASNSVSMIRKL